MVIWLLNVCSLPHSDSGNQNTLDLLHKQIKIMSEHRPSSLSQLRLKIHWFNSGSCPMYSRFHNLMTFLKINSSNNLFECPRVPVVSNFEETIFFIHMKQYYSNTCTWNKSLAVGFNWTFRYIDDVLHVSIDNCYSMLTSTRYIPVNLK